MKNLISRLGPLPLRPSSFSPPRKRIENNLSKKIDRTRHAFHECMVETERFFLRLLPLSRQVDRMLGVSVGECIVECALRETPSHLNIPDVCRGICAMITREKSSRTYNCNRSYIRVFVRH